MARHDPRPDGRLSLLGSLSLVIGSVLVTLLDRYRGRRPSASRPRRYEGRRDRDKSRQDTSGEVGYGRPQSPPSPQARDDGFEPKDAQAGTLGIIMAGGVGTIAAAIAGLFLLLGLFHARDAQGPPLTAQQRAAITPPGPSLQRSPLIDIASLRSREMGKLRGYRWLSPDHTMAQIPIERAMAITVGRPLDHAP